MSQPKWFDLEIEQVGGYKALFHSKGPLDGGIPTEGGRNGENDKVNRSWGLQNDFLTSFIDKTTKEDNNKGCQHIRAVQMRRSKEYDGNHLNMK